MCHYSLPLSLSFCSLNIQHRLCVLCAVSETEILYHKNLYWPLKPQLTPTASDPAPVWQHPAVIVQWGNANDTLDLQFPPHPPSFYQIAPEGEGVGPPNRPAYAFSNLLLPGSQLSTQMAGAKPYFGMANSAQGKSFGLQCWKKGKTESNWSSLKVLVGTLFWHAVFCTLSRYPFHVPHFPLSLFLRCVTVISLGPAQCPHTTWLMYSARTVEWTLYCGPLAFPMLDHIVQNIETQN